MELRTVNINDLIPYENNPRINDGAVDAVVASIKQCGYVAPIIVDENMVILAGHTRHKALKALRKSEVQVIVREGLTEEQKKKFRILDNKTNEFAEWDMEALEAELEELDFSDFDFGFGDFDDMDDYYEESAHDAFPVERQPVQERQSEQPQERPEVRPNDQRREEDQSAEFFQDKETYTRDRQRSEDYEAFLEKFEDKHTTDDCYTPDNIHAVVVDYVEKRYCLDRKNFVRPFYPNGNYQKYPYAPDSIVVDNPPFSIEAEIAKWYAEHDIKFFLYAPALTLFSSSSSMCTSIGVGAGITYENGANVNTSFLTNLEEGVRARSCPELRKRIDEENKKNRAKLVRELPKYEYPDTVITATFLDKLSRYGIDLCLMKKDSMHIRALDSQKPEGKGIFGGGFLISEKAAAEKAAAEKAAAEKAAAEKWKLSDREKELQKSLG